MIIWKKYIEFEDYIDKSLIYFDWKYYINNNINIPEYIDSEEKATNHYNTIGKFLNYKIYPVVYGTNDKKNYLSILAIFKNETMILIPWINHYIWQGVDHIYLIDNDSNDNPLVILQPYIDSGYITLYQLPGKYKQMEHFKYVYEKENLQENTTWLMNIDVDEYFYCNNCDIKNNLRNYEKYWVIYSQWRDFGSNGLKIQPPDPRISFVTRRQKFNWQGKYIIQTKYINLDVFESNPHHLPKIDKNYPEKIINLSDIFILNHYRIMSEEYYKKVKISRGSATQKVWDNLRNMDYFRKYDEGNTFEDNNLKILTIKKFYDYDNLNAFGSLDDRIKLILYYVNQDQTNIQINWILDEYCNEDFNNLFEDIPNIKIITVKNSKVLNNKNIYGFNKNNYKLIKPIQILQNRINNIISLLENANIYNKYYNKYIACHVISNDNYDMYFNFINKYSNELKIYIMTERKNIQEDFINMYNDRIVINKNIDNYTIKEKIIDIFVCKSATYFMKSDNKDSNLISNLQIIK
jgi:hypothetical protein